MKPSFWPPDHPFTWDMMSNPAKKLINPFPGPGNFITFTKELIEAALEEFGLCPRTYVISNYNEAVLR